VVVVRILGERDPKLGIGCYGLNPKAHRILKPRNVWTPEALKTLNP